MDELLEHIASFIISETAKYDSYKSLSLSESERNRVIVIRIINPNVHIQVTNTKLRALCWLPYTGVDPEIREFEYGDPNTINLLLDELQNGKRYTLLDTLISSNRIELLSFIS